MITISTEIITLNLESPEIQHLCRNDKRLAKVISLIGPLEYKIHSDGFAFLIHEIIEQMLSISAGQQIYSRLESLCNYCITPESILARTAEEIKAIGTSRAKAECIMCIANAVSSGDLQLSLLEQLSDDVVIKQLTRYKGVGNWTAKMYLLFVLNRQEILPFEDGAFLQTYRWMYKTEDVSPNAVKRRCRKWEPYSSIASRYLYRALDLGLTKEEFHLYK